MRTNALFAVVLPNGRYLSRARFDPTWDASFEIDHPELWTDGSRAAAVAEDHGGSVVRFVEAAHEPE